MRINVNEVPTDGKVVEFSVEDAPLADAYLLHEAAQWLTERSEAGKDECITAINLETDVMSAEQGLALTTLRLVVVPVPE